MLFWPQASSRINYSVRVPKRYVPALAAFALVSAIALLPPGGVQAASLVTNCNDSGAGSLRDAIATSPTGTTITFQGGLNCSSAGSGPITLTTGTLTIGTDLTIDGSGATIVVDGGCTVSGGVCTSGGVTVFTVTGGVT